MKLLINSEEHYHELQKNNSFPETVIWQDKIFVYLKGYLKSKLKLVTL